MAKNPLKNIMYASLIALSLASCAPAFAGNYGASNSQAVNLGHEIATIVVGHTQNGTTDIYALRNGVESVASAIDNLMDDNDIQPPTAMQLKDELNIQMRPYMSAALNAYDNGAELNSAFFMLQNFCTQLAGVVISSVGYQKAHTDMLSAVGLYTQP